MTTAIPASAYIELDEKALLTALANGDRLALAQLYERYWLGLYRVAFQKTKSHETAEELVQDLFVDLWLKRATLQIRQVEPYLFTALKYAVIDYIRKQVVRERFQDYQHHHTSQTDVGTEEWLAYNDLIGQIEGELQKMPGRTEQIFRLSRFDDQSVPVIAETLRLSEKTVEHHLTKALKTLRHHLQGAALLLGLFSVSTCAVAIG